MTTKNKKSVVVMGGSGLIGSAIVAELKEKGYKTINVDINLMSKDRNLVPDVELKTDISTKEGEERVFQALESSCAEIGGWVNALYPRTKGYGHYNYLDDATDDGIENILLHGSAFYRACRVAVRLLSLSGGGSIVNFGSIYGPLGPDMRIYEGTNLVNPAVYAMAKESILGLTRYIATAFAGKGIRCNAVCPGGVFNNHTDTFVKNYSNRVPMARMAEPSEIATATHFLISEASSYITGQSLMVDGGLSAW